MRLRSKSKIVKVVTLPTGIICTHYKNGNIIVTNKNN